MSDITITIPGRLLELLARLLAVLVPALILGLFLYRSIGVELALIGVATSIGGLASFFGWVFPDPPPRRTSDER